MNTRLLLMFVGASLLSGRLRAEDAALPAPLQPYIEFARQCSRLGAEVFEEFDTNNASWRVVPVTEGAWKPELTLKQVDGRSVLVITPAENSAAGVAVGPPLRGDNRVEMVAYSDADKPCDLSLFFGPVGQSPGFQFGGHNNTRNTLWTDLGGWGHWRAVELPTKPLITPRHWHTVSLTRIGRSLIGSVDGQEVGRTRLSYELDLEAPYEPMVYCYGTRTFVDRFKVYRIGEDGRDVVANVAERWQAAFGELTKADADRKVAELIVLLDHDSSRVRDGAQRLLTQLLPIAESALQQAAKVGSFEQELRARAILRASR